MIRPTKYAPEKSEIEILLTQKTKTVSKKSDLTYHLGKDEESSAYIRIYVNTGNGFFSNEWISLSAIIDILEKHKVASFTSLAFEPLFRGRSSNTPAFLAAVLLNEKVLDFEEGKRRKYVYKSADQLLALISGAKPRKTVKKVASKTTRKSSK